MNLRGYDLAELAIKYKDIGGAVATDGGRCFCTSSKRGAEYIELIYTNNKESSVYNLCKNNYKKQYHVCYIVKSLKADKVLLNDKKVKAGYIVPDTIIPKKPKVINPESILNLTKEC